MDAYQGAAVVKKRVVVTGLGLVTPLGIGVEKSWSNLCSGVSGIDLITRFDPDDYAVKIAGEVKDYTPEDYFEKKQVKHLALFVQYGLIAARMAVKDSGFEVVEENCSRVGVITGCGMGGLPTIAKQTQICVERGPRRITPFFIPMCIPNMASGQISMALKAKGANMTHTTACAAGTHAVGEAYRHIMYGSSDVIITGGTEAVICPLGIAGFSAMKALSKRNDDPQQASRPFDKDRDGFVMSEGAGMLVLEEYEHAIARGARIYAEVCGYGFSSDAYHIAAPPEDGEGGARAMKLALQDSGLLPDDVDYVNAHGTSTPLNDKCETQAIKTVFGDHARALAISSSKSMTGHLLGAAGGIESVFTALSVANQIAPPTINLNDPSPECDLDYVPNVARKMNIRAAISNSFGFGGTNAVVMMKRFDE
jgi:3-oxoacyl-[acyl-carrier-protein] synthase II